MPGPLRPRRPAATAGDPRFGDARLAAEGVGLAEPGGSWAHIAETIEPDARHAAELDRRYALYRDLYPATRDVVHALGRGARSPRARKSS